MAPMFRTCCGFLQVHAACKVGNPRLCIRSGLKVGPKSLYRLPAIQVREFIGISLSTNRVSLSLKAYKLMIFSLSHVLPVGLIKALLELD